MPKKYKSKGKRMAMNGYGYDKGTGSQTSYGPPLKN